MRKTVKILAALIVLLLLHSLPGCNLFGQPDAADIENAEGLIIEGNREFSAGNYNKAKQLYKKAVEKSPSKSEGWFKLHKVTLRIHGLYLAELWDDLNPESSDKIPFFHTDSSNPRSLAEMDSIYAPLRNCRTYLEKIANGRNLDGKYTEKSIWIDYILVNSILGILGPCDVADPVTADSQVFTPNGHLDAPADSKMVAMMRDIKGLNDITFDAESLKAIQGNDPEKINGFIDELENTFGTVKQNTTDFNANARENGVDDTLDFASLADSITKTASYYRYNDSADNDGDYFDTDSNGIADPIKWCDFLNNDDKISTVAPDGAIVTIGAEYYYALGSVSADSLFSLKIDSSVSPNETLFIYTGPHTGEFYAGDWGTDEEIIDNKDNDGDGRIDEDTMLDTLRHKVLLNWNILQSDTVEINYEEPAADNASDTLIIR
ncbi:MAG: hypothetical protein ACLFQK_12220 [Fibrobacterota bacterium]